NPRLHADAMNRHVQRLNSIGQRQVADQEHDDRIEPLAIGAGEQVREHHLSSAELEAVDDVDDLCLHHIPSVALEGRAGNRWSQSSKVPRQSQMAESAM